MLLKKRQPDEPATALNKFCSIRTLNRVYTEFGIDPINLSSIIHVSAETSGFGMDDSEINVHYISSPYYRASGGVTVEEKKFEFPKQYNIQSLYKQLQEVAYRNHEALNK